MRPRILASLLLVVILLAPALAHATVYMVWVVNHNITRVICFTGMLEVANQFDPSQYVNLVNGFSADVVNNLPPSKPVLLNEEQMRELQKILGEP